MTFWIREAVFVDFRRWMWKHDTIFQCTNLSSLTAVTFSVLLKLSGSMNSSWWAVLLPLWIWSGLLTLLMLAWVHNIILYSCCTLYDDNDWKEDDVVFLRNFVLYFIILYPIPAFGFLLCLKLEGLASIPYLGVIAPLLWQLLVILIFSVSQKGGYFMGALVGCIPNPLSRTYYTLVGLFSPVLMGSSLILYAWFQDGFDGIKHDGLGIALSFFLIMFLNVALVGICFLWLRSLPEAALEEDRKLVWMILFTLIPMATFELLLFWSLFPEVSSYQIPSWVCLIPVLVFEAVLWILLSVRVQFWKYLQANSSTCQGHAQLNFAKILTSTLLLGHAGSVTLKLVHISSLPWIVINIPFFVLNLMHLIHLQQFAYRHKINVTQVFLRDLVDTEGDKLKHSSEKRDSTKKVPRKKRKILMDIARTFNKLGHTYLSYLSVGMSLVLLSIRLDGWARIEYFFAILPVLLNLMLQAIHTGFHPWYVNHTLFMMSCYDGVDESPSNSASGVFYSAYFSTSSVGLLLLGILSAWYFDGFIASIWVVIAPLIFLGLLMIWLIGVVVTTEREERKPLVNLTVMYVIPTASMVAALFLDFSGVIDWGIQYCCLPFILMELGNLYKGLSWCQPDAPDQPGAPQVLSSTNDTITLFLIPPFDNGSPILQYLVELVDDRGRARNVCKSASTLVHLKDLNMIPNKPYRFVVRAVNAVGVSPPSEQSDPVELKASKPDKPSPPTISYTPDGVLMKWNNPPDNGFKITSYTVLVRECESNEERYITLDGRCTFYEVVDLKPGRIYGFAVRASNAAGNSKYSNPKTILYHQAHSELF